MRTLTLSAKDEPESRIPAMREKIFSNGRYRHFRKGDIYNDPRIQTGPSQKDFILMSDDPRDVPFLRKYLTNELKKYPAEPYNSFTTGVDANGVPLIGLYWIDDNLTQTKKAMILCTNGCEEAVLEVVDECCQKYDEAICSVL